MPLFSVIVTVYNLEKYIAQCLESLVTQDFANYEVIVVDNGSVDRSLEICQEYVQRYPHIVRLITLEQPSVMHRGHKAGLDAAKGQYIHIMDGDDYVRKGYLQEAAKLILEQSPDVIIGRFSSFTEGNALPSRDAVLAREKINHCQSEEVIRYIRLMPAYHLAFWRYIFKRSLISGGSLFTSSFEENQEFPLLDALVTFRILFAASSYALLEQSFYYYRHRVDSLTAPSAKQLLWHMQSFTEFLMLLQKGQFSGEKRQFILDKLRQELKLTLGKSDRWDQESIEKAALLLEKARPGLNSLTGSDVPDSLGQFFHWLQEQPTLQEDELLLYFARERQAVMEEIRIRNPERAFIFPCGQFARDIQRWMVEEGFHNLSFLDNNPAMDGMIVQGSHCYTTDFLQALPQEELENITVLIATIYEELDDLLMQQCRALGLEEKHLMVCWP